MERPALRRWTVTTLTSLLSLSFCQLPSSSLLSHVFSHRHNRLLLLPQPSYIRSHRASSVLGLLVSHSVSLCHLPNPGVVAEFESLVLASLVSPPAQLRKPPASASSTRTFTLFTSRPIYGIVYSDLAHPSHKLRRYLRILPDLRIDCLTPSIRGSTRPYLHPFGSPRTVIILFCITT